MLDCVASERHFLDHLRPIWNAFPVERKGVFLVPGHLVEYAKSKGIESVAFERSSVVGKVLTPASSVLVSSFRDLKVAQQAHHPTIFSEHGAGQSYSSAHSSYAGGEGRLGVRLFLVPGDHPAERNRRAHPGIPVAVVGCPKLDRWHPAPPWKRPQRPVVAMSFHWDCRIVPETRSAWEHFRGALSDLATDPRWTLIGHGHPRIIEQLRPHYQAAGVEVLADFDEVLERADCYICDNSSTLFEFASAGRPVVVLNSPHYRRNIHHGLRFWECATVGVQVANPDHLVDGVALALEDFETQQEARKRAVARVYKYTDRHATVRAVNAILEVLTVPEHEKPQNPASVRMIANQTFVAPEGRIPKNAEFYPNCVLSRGGWKRIYTGYDLPQRVRWFENRGLARIAPLETTEAKVVAPAEVKEGFSCGQCDRQFPSAASLRGHLTRMHGGA
ncbi:MAG: hypothetical protein AMXMBFR33_01500 [Candidatus Xenobia bacterium]